MINRSLISPRRCSQTRYSLYRRYGRRPSVQTAPEWLIEPPPPPPFSLADPPLFPPLGPPVVAYCSTDGDPVIFPIFSMVVQIGINIELLLRYRYLARYRRREKSRGELCEISWNARKVGWLARIGFDDS